MPMSWAATTARYCWSWTSECPGAGPEGDKEDLDMRRAEKEVKDLEQLEEILRDCNTVRGGSSSL